jgi:hypothetical protein
LLLRSSDSLQLFFLVRSSTSPVRESSAACVESSDVIPRPMTRRPPRAEPEEPDEPEALRADEPDVEPEAFRALPLPLLLDRLLLAPVDRPLLLPLLALLLPPLALIPRRPLLPVPPLLRLGMLILR